MTEEEIKAAAVREFLAGGQSHLEDWIDEEGEYGDDAEAIRAAQWEYFRKLEAEA